MQSAPQYDKGTSYFGLSPLMCGRAVPAVPFRSHLSIIGAMPPGRSPQRNSSAIRWGIATTANRTAKPKRNYQES
jgi:hypothetical protein